MIIIEGDITNKLVNGAKGDFSVGTFVTNIGIFKIKSKLLDQYEEGSYRAKVTVRELKLNSYPARRSGIFISEILLETDNIEILEFEKKNIHSEEIEPDASLPIKSEEAVVPAVKNEPTKPKGKLVLKKSKPDRASPVGKVEGNDNDESLKKLFGPLWPLGDEIRLDTTLPRTTIIEQCDYIRKTHEMLDQKTQIWSRRK